jgi:hypothetical protein
MKNLFIAIAALSLSGCFHKHISFYPTSSPCLDAIFANFSYAKCSSVTQSIELELSSPEYPMIVLSCADSKIENEWTNKTFYVMQNSEAWIDRDMYPVCIDLNSVVFLYYKQETAE